MKKEKKKKKKTRNTKNHKSNMKKSMKGEVVLTTRQIQATRLNQLEYRRLQVNINSMEDDLKIHLARLHRQAQGIRYHYANVVRIVKPNPVYQLSKQGQTDSKNWLGWIISIFLEIFFLKNKWRDIFFLSVPNLFGFFFKILPLYLIFQVKLINFDDNHKQTFFI
jgi:hypothetical protein